MRNSYPTPIKKIVEAVTWDPHKAQNKVQLLNGTVIWIPDEFLENGPFSTWSEIAKAWMAISDSQCKNAIKFWREK